jgi:hypothetical protein
MEMFDLKLLKKVDSEDKYCVKVSNRFVASGDQNSEVEINSA